MLHKDVASNEDIAAVGFRRRGIFELTHVVVSDPTSCKLGKVIGSIILLLIFVSCTCFVLETVPSLQSWKDGCELCAPVSVDNVTAYEQRLLRGEIGYCDDCEPVVASIFASIETIAVTFFSVEYGLRLLTAWAVTHYHRPAVIHGVTIVEAEPGENSWSGLFKTVRFVLEPMNLIDLIAILPYYIELSGAESASLTFIRLLRLFRVIRMMKVAKLSGSSAKFMDGMLMVGAVFRRSRQALSITFVVMMFAMVMASSVIFTFERGIYDPATGEYKVSGLDPYAEKQSSLYQSIPETFWWTLVTFTTVGYGDMSPTTGWGRMFAVLVMYVGVLFIAMPISIIGGTFAEEYASIQNMRRKAREKWLKGARTLVNLYFNAANADIANAFDTWYDWSKREVELQGNVRTIIREELNDWFGVEDALENSKGDELAVIQAKVAAVDDRLAEFVSVMTELSLKISPPS